MTKRQPLPVIGKSTGDYIMLIKGKGVHFTQKEMKGKSLEEIGNMIQTKYNNILNSYIK